MNPIQLPVAEVKTALTGLSKVISRRTTLPVLGCVRVSRDSAGQIALAATDLDASVIARLHSPDQGEPRAMLVPFEDLTHIVKGCGRDDTLLLSAFAKDKVAIKFPVAGDAIEHQCDSFPLEEFPPIPVMTGEACPLEPDLRQAIRQAFECASTDETRVVINSAYLDVSKPDAHYVVGTDGRHLFSSNSFMLPLKDSVIIPSHRFVAWKPFNDDGDWNLRVSKEKNAERIEIASTHWRFITKAVEGNFPNWRQVIPGSGEFVTGVEFDPDAVDEVIRTIARMPSDDAMNHKVGIEINGRKVSLLGKSPGAEKWTSVQVAEAKASGKDVKVFLNRKFLTKALRFGLTRVDVIDPLSPVRFSAGGRQMIVMPIRPDATVPQTQRVPASEPPAETTTTAEPTNPPPPAETERTNMPESNGNGATRSTAPEKPALETALVQIEKIKTSYREAIAGLNDLTGLLRQAQREHKNSDKEVASVRQTLRSLQSVRI